MSWHKSTDALTDAQLAKLILLAQSDDPPTYRQLGARFNISKGWVGDLLRKVEFTSARSSQVGVRRL